MKLRTLLVFFASVAAGTSHSEPNSQTEEPGACMEGYGFRCEWVGLPSRSVGAYALGCNARLSDGRLHFVQILHADGGWNVEVEETYLPDRGTEEQTAEDPRSILSAYVSEAMGDYQMHSSGDDISGVLSEPLYIETGTRRQGGQIDVRAVCGVLLGDESNDAVPVMARSACERRMLRTIKLLSQPKDASPYRAAGAGEIEWEDKTVTLVSGDIVLVVEGRYTFPKNHRPCRWMSDCCLGHGPAYLDSCRSPTEREMQAVKTCMAEGLRRRSGEFSGCLRDANVKVGCDEQADGSRICY